MLTKNIMLLRKNLIKLSKRKRSSTEALIRHRLHHVEIQDQTDIQENVMLMIIILNEENQVVLIINIGINLHLNRIVHVKKTQKVMDSLLQMVKKSS